MLTTAQHFRGDTGAGDFHSAAPPAEDGSRTCVCSAVRRLDRDFVARQNQVAAALVAETPGVMMLDMCVMGGGRSVYMYRYIEVYPDSTRSPAILLPFCRVS